MTKTIETSLQKLLDRCKASIHLTVNQHKAYYQTVEYYLSYILDINNEKLEEEIEPNILKDILTSGNLIELQFYPDTPIGSYKIYGATLENVCEQANEILEEIK